MILEVQTPGLLTTVQDLGRWGYQGKGMPVAGAMDPQVLQIGNILVGNNPQEAALEITAMGPKLIVTEGEGLIVLVGAELGFNINGVGAPMWQSIRVKSGDEILVASPKGRGCRTYLCLLQNLPLLIGRHRCPGGNGKQIYLSKGKSRRLGRAPS